MSLSRSPVPTDPTDPPTPTVRRAPGPLPRDTRAHYPSVSSGPRSLTVESHIRNISSQTGNPVSPFFLRPSPPYTSPVGPQVPPPTTRGTSPLPPPTTTVTVVSPETSNGTTSSFSLLYCKDKGGRPLILGLRRTPHPPKGFLPRRPTLSP